MSNNTRKYLKLLATAGLSAGAVLLPAAALAQETSAATQSQSTALTCPMEEASEELRTNMLLSFAGELPEGSSVQFTEDLGAVTDTCAIKHGISRDDRLDYGTYTLAIIANTITGDGMAEAGFKLDVVDRVFDIGPGRENPDDVELTEARFVEVAETGVEDGIDAMLIPRNTWALVGAYVASKADVEQYLESLRN